MNSVDNMPCEFVCICNSQSLPRTSQGRIHEEMGRTTSGLSTECYVG